MQPYIRTRIVLLAALALLLVYELWVIATHQPDSTISEAIWSVARAPMIPFTFGVLMGHFFWQRQDVYTLARVPARTPYSPGGKPIARYESPADSENIAGAAGKENNHASD